MKIGEIAYNLKVKGKAYWNPNTLDVIFYDHYYDELPNRPDIYPTFCLAGINFWKYDEYYDDIYALIDYDSYICRTEALGRIFNEDGWILMDSPESECMFWKKLGEFAAECVRKEERKYGE